MEYLKKRIIISKFIDAETSTIDLVQPQSDLCGYHGKDCKCIQKIKTVLIR